jgi:DNA-binding GntR family transcriptional regulator
MEIQRSGYMARKKSGAVDSAYEIILKRILSFELMPGEIVSDLLLSKQLKMSRTPVREAVMRLEIEGLLVRGETRVVVSGISAHDIREICEVREAIENKAAGLILRNGGLSEKQMSELRRFNDEMNRNVEKGDFSTTNDFDDKLHSAIVLFSENNRLAEYYHRMRMQFKRARWLTILNPKYKISVKEHSAIIDALAERNEKKTRAAIEQHLSNAADNFNTVLNDRNVSMLRKSIDLLPLRSAPVKKRLR